MIHKEKAAEVLEAPVAAQKKASNKIIKGMGATVNELRGACPC